MIDIMKPNATKEDIQTVVSKAESLGVQTHPIFGENRTVVALVGDLTRVSRETFNAMDSVAETVRIQEPYKLSSRSARPHDTIIEVGTVRIGGPEIVIMAGPCSVEGREQIIEHAHAVKEYLAEAREATGLPIITEVMTVESLPAVAEYTDILQIGARNMQNYGLLQAVGKVDRPVMLKRGMSGTIEEWLMCAEYIVSNGNTNVMLCERGIRTYETATRNTFDLNAVPVVKQRSHLPVVADPSHGTGYREYVSAMSRASVAAGADALILEVHPDPDKALSDGRQSIDMKEFANLVISLRRIAEAVDRKVAPPLGKSQRVAA
jgi:3-deoxy-7-phosphoheptulonate synthase